MDIEVESCVRGHHVYSTIWTPVLGELLSCRRELDNSEDRYAVAICNVADTVIGHIPRKISFLCSVFIRRGGVIRCIVNGDRQYSHDLPQGGMEVPCRLVFSGAEKDLNKVKKYLEDCNMKVVARLSACIRNVEENMDSVDVKQEPLDVSSTSSTACMPTSITIKEKASPPTKRVRYDDNKSVTQKVGSTCSNVTIWIKIDRIALTLADKHTIADDLKLHDKHIQFGQCMIHHQFPGIGGLRYTLLQERYYEFPRNSIQAIFCKARQHWVVASNMHTIFKSNLVYIYDSIFDQLDDESLLLVKTMFSNSSGCTVQVQMANLQKQRGGNDCGVFSIAAMVSLAFGEDPGSVKYNQEDLRPHLLQCFEFQKFSLFPRE